MAAPITVKATVQARETSKYYKSVKNNIIPSVTAQSLTSIARRGRKGSIAFVSNRVNVPKRAIGKRQFIRRAKPKDLKAIWTFYTRNIPWISLNGRQTRKGASSQAGSAVRAFEAKDPRGRKQIFQRLGKKAYPINVLSVKLQPFEKESSAIFSKVAQRAWRKTFNKAMGRRLRKKGITGFAISDVLRGA